MEILSSAEHESFKFMAANMAVYGKGIAVSFLFFIAFLLHEMNAVDADGRFTGGGFRL